jgi:hypothetical protein
MKETVRLVARYQIVIAFFEIPRHTSPYEVRVERWPAVLWRRTAGQLEGALSFVFINSSTFLVPMSVTVSAGRTSPLDLRA